MKIYISGPITGIPNHKKAFEIAAKEVSMRNPYSTIINPAGLEGNVITGLSMAYEDYMEIDLQLLDLCDAIYFIDGWKQSRGCNIEYGYAIAKGKKIMQE